MCRYDGQLRWRAVVDLERLHHSGTLARSRSDGLEVFDRTGEAEAAHLGTIEPAGEPSDVHITDGGSILYAAGANDLRNPGSHLMSLGGAPISCD